MSRSQPWRRRTRPLEYFQASDFEKLLWACGIPSRYWNVAPSSVRPTAITYQSSDGIKRVSASVQADYIKDRVGNPDLLLNNRFACLASHPSDEHAMAAACLLARAAIQDAWENDEVVKVRVIDIQDFEGSLAAEESFFTVTPSLLFIHNLNEDSPKERISLARDLVLSMEGIYRAVVVASDSSLKFARDFMRMEPQEVYQFEGKPHRVMSR